MMALSLIRFWSKGWIETVYLTPTLHFHYFGFDWVTVPGNFVYLVFIVSGLAALLLAIGWHYRVSALVFFLSFTFIELMEKTTYLNHYYFVSVISLLLLFLPAHCTFSVDAKKNEKLRAEFVPAWCIDVLKLMLAIVYIYAGLAKLNPDWLLKAMPLAIWLPSKADLPLLGGLMHKSWMAYLFSWVGAFYDLFIVFFLCLPATRVFAYILVVVFHLLTAMLFPIGMFPYIMIVSTLIFFSSDFHERILGRIATILQIDHKLFKNGVHYSNDSKLSPLILGAIMTFQLLFPWRHLILTDNVYWSERGYRFSWRVMLMEKTGYANFKIVDGKTGQRFYVQNEDFLTALQQKEMSTQPDFILEYGQYLGRHFAAQGHQNVEVYVESYAALNGRKSQTFIAADVDLMKVSYSDLVNNHLSTLND